MSESLIWSLGCNPSGLIPSTVRRASPPKSPGDLIPVAGDFRAALDSIDCDSLNPNYTPVTNVLRNDGNTPDLFVIGTPSINSDNTRVTTWIGGGSLGYEYLVQITVQSNDGQFLTRSYIIGVAIR